MPESSNSPFRWGATPMTATHGPTGAARGGVGRGILGAPTNDNRDELNLRPLRDITNIMRAIERRRPSLRESEGLQIDRPTTQDQIVLVLHKPASGAQIEHDLPNISLVITSQAERQKRVRALMSMR